MEFSPFGFDFFHQLFDLIVQIDHTEVIFGVVWLLEFRTGHLWDYSIQSDKKISPLQAPLTCLILLETTLVRSLRNKRHVLVWHLFNSFALFPQLFLFALLSCHLCISLLNFLACVYIR